jgi:uncharacterized protein (TIGR00369 family)
MKQTHRQCFMCGQDNPRGLGLDFTATDDGEVSAVFRGQPALQGYPDILHGGIISALLDSAMTNCLFNHDICAVTAELRVRFRHPIPCSAEIVITARISEQLPPLYRMSGEIRHQGRIMARAEARFMLKR